MSALSENQSKLLRYYAYHRPGWLGALGGAISAGLQSLGSGYPPSSDALAQLRSRDHKLASFPEQLESAVTALLQEVESESQDRPE